MATGALRMRNLLVVEDDPDTSHLLQTYFSGHGYEVNIAERGSVALENARKQPPDLVLLDIILPEAGLDGLAVCKALRTSARTGHIPIIFLTEKSTASDRLAGLSAGAQDYITKPFDLEELRLRIKNIIARAERDNMLDPRTGLPTGNILDDQIRRVAGLAGWSKIECHIDSFRPFVDLNGFAAGDDVLKLSARLLRDLLNQASAPDDFIGHPANDSFIILTQTAEVSALGAQIAARFNDEVKAHYSFTDREQGYVLIRDANGQEIQTPLMTLKVVVSAA